MLVYDCKWFFICLISSNDSHVNYKVTEKRTGATPFNVQIFKDRYGANMIGWTDNIPPRVRAYFKKVCEQFTELQKEGYSLC